MIGGIGIDLCDISRMRKAISREGFLERIFSDEEVAYAESKADPAVHYAAAFAAREALAKATGWGIAGLGLKSCPITRKNDGPKFVFDEELKARLEKMGVTGVFLSITHESGLAAAVVVLEKVL